MLFKGILLISIATSISVPLRSPLMYIWNFIIVEVIACLTNIGFETLIVSVVDIFYRRFVFLAVFTLLWHTWKFFKNLVLFVVMMDTISWQNIRGSHSNSRVFGSSFSFAINFHFLCNSFCGIVLCDSIKCLLRGLQFIAVITVNWFSFLTRNISSKFFPQMSKLFFCVDLLLPPLRKERYKNMNFLFSLHLQLGIPNFSIWNIFNL